jgi:hypothetical protein
LGGGPEESNPDSLRAVEVLRIGGGNPDQRHILYTFSTIRGQPNVAHPSGQDCSFSKSM